VFYNKTIRETPNKNEENQMRLYASENGSWGIIPDDLDKFTIVNTDDWSSEDFNLLSDASDSDKVRIANEIRERLDQQGEIARTVWESLDGKLEELYDLATELDSIEIHALAVDIREALGGI
jgi:hypothetical protein